MDMMYGWKTMKMFFMVPGCIQSSKQKLAELVSGKAEVLKYDLNRYMTAQIGIFMNLFAIHMTMIDHETYWDSNMKTLYIFIVRL